jgi:lysophospholipase L1-like esterase
MPLSLVRFVCRLAGCVVLFLSASICLAQEKPVRFGQNLQMRGSLDASRLVFERKKLGHVAFIGGSITEMEGYRPLVCEQLKKRFPQTTFTFTNAGIASTCSNTGAFRLTRDVFANGLVDLLFVEFAVNDDQDGHFSREECIRGMEGIVRRARLENPRVDIVMTFFVNESMLESYRVGKVPLSIEAHETVARHYEVPTSNVAKQLCEEIAAGTTSWRQYGGVHPGPLGNALAAEMISEILNRSWAKPLPNDAPVHLLPKAPLDGLSYFAGRLLEPKAAQLKAGWTLEVPNWKNLPGGTRSRFEALPMLCATAPGAELTLDFSGNAIGAFVVAGPDAGVAEVSIDSGVFRSVNLFHEFSANLHYPRTVMLASELSPGKHSLTLRISSQTQKSGFAMRIMAFSLN